MEVFKIFGKDNRLTTTIIVIDDRVASGERPDRSGSVARIALTGEGDGGKNSEEKIFADTHIEIVEHIIIHENADEYRRALATALIRARFVLTIGATGLRPTSIAPEVTREFLHLELPGVQTQILLQGLNSTSKAGLSRGLVGTTAEGQLIANAPSSSGGVKDTLQVLVPLLPAIFQQLDEVD